MMKKKGRLGEREIGSRSEKALKAPPGGFGG
jgi:hypothetical protein